MFTAHAGDVTITPASVSKAQRTAQGSNGESLSASGAQQARALNARSENTVAAAAIISDKKRELTLLCQAPETKQGYVAKLRKSTVVCALLRKLK